MSDKQEERQELLFDIFVTAIEGGINYWAICDSYHWLTAEKKEDIKSFYATIREEEGDEESFTINATTISYGLHLIVNDRVKINTTIKDTIKLALKELDGCYIDAECADCIIQAGLFKELVYG